MSVVERSAATANGLVQKGLAEKGTFDGEVHIRYWLTVDGMNAAAALLEAGP